MCRAYRSSKSIHSVQILSGQYDSCGFRILLMRLLERPWRQFPEISSFSSVSSVMSSFGKKPYVIWKGQLILAHTHTNKHRHTHSETHKHRSITVSPRKTITELDETSRRTWHALFYTDEKEFDQDLLQNQLKDKWLCVDSSIVLHVMLVSKHRHSYCDCEILLMPMLERPWRSFPDISSISRVSFALSIFGTSHTWYEKRSLFWHTPTQTYTQTNCITVSPRKAITEQETGMPIFIQANKILDQVQIDNRRNDKCSRVDPSVFFHVMRTKFFASVMACDHLTRQT